MKGSNEGESKREEYSNNGEEEEEDDDSNATGGESNRKKKATTGKTDSNGENIKLRRETGNAIELRIVSREGVVLC